jgi:hypothetical protein
MHASPKERMDVSVTRQRVNFRWRGGPCSQTASRSWLCLDYVVNTSADILLLILVIGVIIVIILVVCNTDDASTLFLF